MLRMRGDEKAGKYEKQLQLHHCHWHAMCIWFIQRLSGMHLILLQHLRGTVLTVLGTDRSSVTLLMPGQTSVLGKQANGNSCKDALLISVASRMKIQLSSSFHRQSCLMTVVMPVHKRQMDTCGLHLPFTKEPRLRTSAYI